MSPPNWLPPLNSHSHHQLTAVASQLEPPRNNPSLPHPMFVITTEVSVLFYPENGGIVPGKVFKGLSMQQDFSLPCYTLTSPQFFHASISNLLEHMLAPFELENPNFFWIEKHWLTRHSNGREGNEVRVLDDLVAKIRYFACAMRAQAYNAGHNVLPLKLAILKRVRVPDFQLNAWNSWYAHNLRKNPGFKREYMAAISRPRTGKELMYGEFPDCNECTTLGVRSLQDKMMELSLFPDFDEAIALAIGSLRDKMMGMSLV